MGNHTGSVVSHLVAAPSRFGSRRVVIAASGLAVAAAFALGAVVRLAGDDERSTPGAVAAGSAQEVPLPATSEVRRGPTLPPDRVPAVDTIAVVHSNAEVPWVDIVDTASGRTLASTETAYNPIVSFRRGRAELLLTHQPLAESGAGRDHVLDILDLNNELSPKKRIAIPGRPNYKIAGGGAWQAISNDERFFAVYSFSLRTELPECQVSPADGPSCTRSRVRVIDLDSEEPSEWLFELPRHCFGGLVPHGVSGFLATCGTGFYLLDSGYAKADDSAPAPRYLPDPVQARNLAGGVLWISPGEGWFGTLIADGSFVWTKAETPEISRAALPAGRQLRWPIFAEIGSGRLVAGYVDRYYEQYPFGLAVFNMTTGEVERELPGYEISRSMVAGGPDELLATTRDGRLIAITVSTGAARTLAPLDSDPEDITLAR